MDALHKLVCAAGATIVLLAGNEIWQILSELPEAGEFERLRLQLVVISAETLVLGVLIVLMVLAVRRK